MDSPLRKFLVVVLSIAALLYCSWVLHTYALLVLPSQAFTEALRRITSAVLAVVALGACSYGLGSLLCKRWLPDFEDLLEGGLIRIALGTLLLSHLVLVLGLTGLLARPVGFVLVGLGILLGVRALLDLVRCTRGLESRVISPTNLLLGTLTICLLLLGLRPALLPPTSYDVLWYHYGIPRMYLQAHGIFPTPDLQIAGYPSGAEMLYMLAMLLESDLASNLVNFMFGVGTCLSSIALARRLRVSPPLLAGMLFVGTPLVMTHLSEAYVELAQAFFLSLAFLTLVKALEATGQHPPPGRPTGMLVTSALLMGGAMSIKYNSNVVFLLMVVWLLIQLRAQRGMRPAARIAVWYAAIALAVVSPWYLKNLVFYGHPFYPVFVAQSDGALRDLLAADHQRGWRAFLRAAWDSTMQPAQHFSRTAMGPLFLMLIPWGLFFRRWSFVFRSMLFLCSGYWVVWFWTWQNLRFLIPVLPMLATLAAYPISRVRNGSRVGSVLGGIAIVLVCGITLYSNLDPATLSAHPSLNAENRHAYYQSFAIRGYLASYDAWRWIDENVEEDAVIVPLWDEASMYFRTRKTLNPSAHGSFSTARLIESGADGSFAGFKNGILLLGTLKGLGATHFLVNARRAGRARPTDAFFTDQVEEIYARNGIFLYRLPPAD